VLCHALDGVKPPQQLADRDFIYFYSQPKSPGSGFGPGFLRLEATTPKAVDVVRPVAVSIAGWPLND
jgi:hypothetical protein